MTLQEALQSALSLRGWHTSVEIWWMPEGLLEFDRKGKITAFFWDLEMSAQFSYCALWSEDSPSARRFREGFLRCRSVLLLVLSPDQLAALAALAPEEWESTFTLWLLKEKGEK